MCDHQAMEVVEVSAVLQQHEPRAEDRRHLAAIRSAREASAQVYFARHAAEWDTLRSLHLSDELVEAALGKALAGKLGALLDVGTGTGRMAQLFAPQASHVTAFDKSPEMLRLARARLQALPPELVELVQGDFTALPFGTGQFDTLLFHQVLHYAQAPEAVLAEAGLLIPDESDEEASDGAVREDEVEKFKEFLDSISPDDFKAT